MNGLLGLALPRATLKLLMDTCTSNVRSEVVGPSSRSCANSIKPRNVASKTGVLWTIGVQQALPATQPGEWRTGYERTTNGTKRCKF